MSKRIQNLYLYSVSAFLFVVPKCVNIVWQAVDISQNFYSARFLIVLSLIVEAALFYLLIKNITVLRACCISLVGNIVSFLAIIYLMPIVVLGLEAVLAFELGITINLGVFINWVLMYLGSVGLEVGILRICFNYLGRQLVIPVVMGNLITYILAFIYLKYQ